MRDSAVRVLHLVNNFRHGGLENVIKMVVLDKNEAVQSYVCVLGKIGPFAEDVARRNIPVLHLYTPESNWKSLIHVVSEVIRAIKRHQIHVLHCHDLNSWYVGGIAGRLTRRRIIFTKHGCLEEWNIRNIALTKILSALTDQIIAVSPYVKEDLVKRQHISGRKIDIVLNGIDIDRYLYGMNRSLAKKRIQCDESTFVLGSVTRFFAVKNIEMQLDLVEAIVPQIDKVKYLLIAPINSEYAQFIIQSADRRKLSSHIEFLGYRADVPELLRAIDVFVMTSISEGTSLALLEAMASGCAVVASAVGGNRTLIEHGVNGFLFDVPDLHELVKDVLFYRENPEQRARFGMAAQESVRKYGLEHMVSRYQHYYRQGLRQ